ncbi:putative sulfate exporter family transporter [uncultured Cetobacterium sp.]|uniref:YeiH family protein n=1 Tax=uncultured Cetobacterium sp. TaxID=527638 RepID=UPI0025F5B019|nr:putative sulfate exporter family transporter [uncultured Cetobacterium sp.]
MEAIKENEKSLKETILDLFKFEDYWAILLATILLVFCMFIYMGANSNAVLGKAEVYNDIMKSEGERASFKTVEWHEAQFDKNALTIKTSLSQKVRDVLGKPKKWTTNPLESVYLSESAALEKGIPFVKEYEELKKATSIMRENALAATVLAEEKNFADEELNKVATTSVDEWLVSRDKEIKLKAKAIQKPYNLIPNLVILLAAIGVYFSFGMKKMGRDREGFLQGFPFVFLLATSAYLLGEQEALKAWGLGYVFWGLVLGLIVSNTVGTPKKLLAAAQTEYFIKTGLILLGSTVLVNKVLLIGIPGIFVTWFVTPIVLVLTFLFGDKVLKMESKSLNMVMSADMSVSGVSAAIAAAAACKAKKEELTLSVSISIMFTAFMMIAMPMFIKMLNMDPVLGGAWIGGTVDSTGAVVAAGEYLGPVARDVAATIKMIQNIIIGVMALGVAAYWSLKVDTSMAAEKDFSLKGSLLEIWNRFPKFILGFIGASLVFSGIYAMLGVDGSKIVIDKGMVNGLISPLQGWLFCLAFTSIGLSTNFSELSKLFKGGKPITLYIVGKIINLGVTFGAAYLMFHVIFPDITKSLMSL